MATEPPTHPFSEAKTALKGDHDQKKLKWVEKQDLNRALTRATSELLFVLLPFIVIGIALAHLGELRTIFFISEWSIVSAVIVGQAIVKVASAAVGRSDVEKQAIILIISILLVCLLVPILSILAIALTERCISTRLAVTQGVFFLLSSVIFLIASVIEYLAEHTSWPSAPVKDDPPQFISVG